VILIGNNSKHYQQKGWTCLDLMDKEELIKYYKQIKYIVQDSYYESCSNVMVEGWMYGCEWVKNILIITSQYPSYGGAATNSYNIHNVLQNYKQFNTHSLFIHNEMISKTEYNPNNYLNIHFWVSNISNLKNAILNIKNNYKQSKLFFYYYDYILAKNYFTPILSSHIFNYNKLIYMVSGINQLNNYNKPAHHIITNKEQFKVIYTELLTIQKSDIIIINSQLTLDIFNYIYDKYLDNKKIILDNTSSINFNKKSINNINIANKKYDIIIVCSNLERTCKNNLFLIKLLNLPDFHSLSKCVIGTKNEKFENLHNTDIYELMTNSDVLEYMKLSKILLFPSFYDSNPNTIYEAYFSKCLVLTTYSVGIAKYIPTISLCESYQLEEWSNKLKFLIQNFPTLIKDFKINYPESNLVKYIT
jgi:glycosyltransferase involved in cell wall biosynthesis